MPEAADDRGSTHTIESLARRATDALRDRLGVEAVGAAAAPGRVNLIGEHTDYNGGFVLPMAIDRACVAVGARARDPERSRVLAVDLGESVEADLRSGLVASRTLTPLVAGRHIRMGSWPGYVLGPMCTIAYIARAKGRETFNLDIAVTSSVPLGSGLSSSASLEVAAATLAERLWDAALPPRVKVGVCRDAEHEYAGVPCGIMDQMISVMGVEGHALLIDCRQRNFRPVPMPPLQRAVVVVMNSNVRHALASGEYARRRETCRAAAEKLGVSELRDATPDLLLTRGSALSQTELMRARHVVSENERTLAAAAALSAGDLGAVGRLMNESHESLRRDYEVSCAELDTLVEAARAVPGVLGARMTGGGFGGCAIALIEPWCIERAREHVSGVYASAFGRAPALFPTAACAGARAWGIGAA